MHLEQNFLFDALTCRNYFPTQRKEPDQLPPVFHSKNFHHAAFELQDIGERKGGFGQVAYRETRFNKSARTLSIPHPVAHARLAMSIVEHWGEIESFCNSENSQVKPEKHEDGRTIILNYGFITDRVQGVLDNSFGMNFKVHADVKDCFSSIESQAIVQAATPSKSGSTYGKKPEPPHWAYEIEDRLKAAQQGHTKGLPVGPATSNILSEIVFGQVDKALRQNFKFERYVDDFTCYCKTHEEAQRFIRQLSDELMRFNLELNHGKTLIEELPVPVDQEWIVKLQLHKPGEYDLTSAQRYLDYALCLSKQYPDGNVLKYAVKSIVGRLEDYAKYPVMTNILNLCRYHPCLLSCIQGLMFDDELYMEIGNDHFGPHLNLILEESARAKRSDGMCWALYYLKRLSLSVTPTAASEIIKSGDCLAMVLLYHSGADRYPVLSFLKRLHDQNNGQLLDSYWLLAYEVFKTGEYDDYYDEEPSFRIMLKYDVSFVKGK